MLVHHFEFILNKPVEYYIQLSLFDELILGES